MILFRNKGIFVVGFWWHWDISDLPLVLTTSLTNLVCPKRFPILALVCLDHYLQPRLMTKQPTHQLSQLIILILQAINIVCKIHILHNIYSQVEQILGIGALS
jgi:hypothetical protein